MKKLSDLAGLRDRAIRVARAAEIPLDKPELSVMLVTRLLAKAIEADEDGLRAALQSFNQWLASDWCQKESPRDRFAHCFEQFIGGTLEDFLARAAIGLLLHVRAESARWLQEGLCADDADESLAAYLSTHYPTLSGRIYTVIADSSLFERGDRGWQPLFYLFSLCRSLDFDLVEFVELRLTYLEFTQQTDNDNE